MTETTKGPRRLRLISDGTCHGTRLFLDNGEEVHGVSRVEFVIDARARAVAEVTITCERVPVDVTGELKLERLNPELEADRSVIEKLKAQLDGPRAPHDLDDTTAAPEQSPDGLAVRAPGLDEMGRRPL